MKHVTKMTKALEEYLLLCPTGKWFEIDDVWKMPRARYNLDRLVQAGKLKSKLFNSNVYDRPEQGQLHTLKYKTIKS